MQRIPTLYLLVGLPGSGKSTWAKTRKARVLSADAIRKYVLEPAVWGEFARRLNSWLKLRTSLIIDNTNLSRAIRRKMIEPALKRGYRVVALVFNTKIELCAYRKPHIPLSEFVAMAEIYQRPDVNECMARVYDV